MLGRTTKQLLIQSLVTEWVVNHELCTDMRNGPENREKNVNYYIPLQAKIAAVKPLHIHAILISKKKSIFNTCRNNNYSAPPPPLLAPYLFLHLAGFTVYITQAFSVCYS
jgi:hypothetical protein